MIFFWLIIGLFFLVLELGNVGLFFFLSFFFGATAAALVSLCTDSLSFQSSIFLGASVCAFWVLKYWLKKEQKNIHRTNIYALQGKKALVLQDVSLDAPGAVKVGGEIWSAKPLEKNVCVAGSWVTVVRVEGAHLIVSSLN
jgi:membrane protein implicated in regulation of membrane protease activity